MTRPTSGRTVRAALALTVALTSLALGTSGAAAVPGEPPHAAQAAETASGERVVARLGARASGLWLDRADGRAVVDVTGARAAAEVRAAGVRARLVRYDANRLETVQRQLARLLVPHTAVGTDVAANQIVVTVGAAARRTTKLLAATAAQGAMARVEYTDGAFGTAIAGGHPIDYLGQNIGCSLGFNTTGGVAVTAGHCTAGSAEWENGNNNRYFGPSIAANFPGDDFGLIRNDGGLSQTGDVYNYSSGATQDITGAAHNYVGQYVCKSGRTTGTTCAYIDQVNVTVNYPQGTVFQLVQGEFCVRPGDSGGAVFHGGTAKGLVSGTGGGCRSFYQPVVEALQAYGVWVF